MNRLLLLLLIVYVGIFSTGTYSQEQDLDTLLSFDLEEQMNVKVTVISQRILFPNTGSRLNAII